MDSTLERSIRRAGRSGKLPHSVHLFRQRRPDGRCAILRRRPCSARSRTDPVCAAPPAARSCAASTPTSSPPGHDDAQGPVCGGCCAPCAAMRSSSPTRARPRCFIFPDCRRLTVQDQNVLLKLVEEGPAYAAFLFCAESRRRAAAHGALAVRGARSAPHGAGEASSCCLRPGRCCRPWPDGEAPRT